MILGSLKKIFRSRYVLYLEAELERERDINQQLVNALLSHAGMPQVGSHVSKKTPVVQGKLTPSQLRAKFEQQDRKNMTPEAS